MTLNPSTKTYQPATLVNVGDLILVQVTSLDLRRCNVPGNALEALANSPFMTNLATLVLSDNHVGNVSTRALVRTPFLKSLTALDLSRVYHHVLERLVASAIREGVDLSDPAAAVTQDAIRAYARQIGQALRGELMLSSARNEYLLARVEKTLTEVVAAHREMMRRGQFRPMQSGVKFDGAADSGTALPPLKLTTPGGAELALRGRIDRVDVLPESGDAAVFDYRLGSRSLSLPDVYHGLSLQLLASLLALGAAGEAMGTTLKPAAAFYLQMARGIGEVKHPSEALDPAWTLGEQRFEVALDAEPPVSCTFHGLHPPVVGEQPEIGLIAPAMHCVNAIPYVCRAEPGIKTYLDLPLLAGRAAPR